MDIHAGNTKEIMANSQLEITDPAFNKMVLGKIMKKRQSRLIIYHIFFYLLLVAIVLGVIVTTSNGIDSFANIVMNAIVALGSWFLTNEFVIIPFFILLIIKGVIDIAIQRRLNS